MLVYRSDIDILHPPNNEHLSVSNKIEGRAFVNLQHEGRTCTYHKQTVSSTVWFQQHLTHLLHTYEPLWKYAMTGQSLVNTFHTHVYLCLFAVGIF